MTLDANKFPLYGILDKLGAPGVDLMREEFNKAASGSDEDKYLFALGIQTVALMDNVEKIIPGVTKAITQRTLESCLEVFEDVGSRNHEDAAYVAASYYVVGTGCKQDFAKAAQWIAKCDMRREHVKNMSNFIQRNVR